MRTPDHGDIQNRWSPSQDLSNDVSNLVKIWTFINSTFLKIKVWDGIFSHEGVGSRWYSKSVISKLIHFLWWIISEFMLNFYNLYKFKSLLIVLKTLSSVISIFLDFSSQAIFLKSLNMWRIQIFELQKIYYTIQKVLKSSIQLWYFQKNQPNSNHRKNPITLKL